MTERRNPKLFQVLVCQMGQDSKGNVVLGKALRVLPEADVLKPVRNLLHRARRARRTLCSSCSLEDCSWSSAAAHVRTHENDTKFTL